MKVCTTCGAEYPDEKLFCERDGTPLRKSGAVNDLMGQVIADRYHITKKLGEGGMGQVYLAEHVKMGRRCAIKIMMPGTMSDPEAISRFNREAANASRISHPNVCAIYDFGETSDGLIYLAMEFIEGKSLTGLLEEVGTLPLARAAAIIQQCAEALQVAHDLGIVHRDLKPDNIMVSTTRGKDTVKVVDFGIAKAIGGDDGGAQKVTKTGFVVGTPEYMSPEQLSGDPVDGRSDLYSLGLVFYRMLTGVSPFPADSQQETMIKRLTDDPLPLAVARPDVRFPAEVQQVLDRALMRTPNDRYRTAGDLARDVRNLSTHATGQVDAEAGTQKVRPEDLKAGPPATRVDPLSAEKKRKPPASTQPIQTPPARKAAPVVPIAVAVLLLAAGGGVYAMRDRLFGRGPAAAVPDSTALQRPDTTHNVDTIRTQAAGTVDSGKPVNPGGRTGGGTVNPPPRRDSLTKPAGGTGVPPPTSDAVALGRQVEAYYEDVEFVEDARKRVAARSLGEQVFGIGEVPAKVRAKAAFLVAQVCLKENDREGAKLWLDKAILLDSSITSWKELRDQL